MPFSGTEECRILHGFWRPSTCPARGITLFKAFSCLCSCAWSFSLLNVEGATYSVSQTSFVEFLMVFKSRGYIYKRFYVFQVKWSFWDKSCLVQPFGKVVSVQKRVFSKTCHITSRIHLRCLRIFFFFLHSTEGWRFSRCIFCISRSHFNYSEYP